MNFTTYTVSHADLAALERHASTLLASRDWSAAQDFYSHLLNITDTYSPALLGMYMAKNELADMDALFAHLAIEGQSILMENDLLLGALKYADPILTAKIKEAVNSEALFQKNSDAVLAAIAIREDIAKTQTEIETLLANSKNRVHPRSERKTMKQQAEELSAGLAGKYAALSAALHDVIVLGRTDLLNIGDRFLLGCYQQESLPAAPSPISWRVISRDDRHITAVSEYILDILPITSENRPCIWHNSSLKYWLNNDFLNHAFTASERLRFFENGHLGKVSIPSEHEFKTYLYRKKCVTPLTQYSESRRAAEEPTFWLRSDSLTPAGVFPYVNSYDISQNPAHVYRGKHGVRPMIYLKLK